MDEFNHPKYHRRRRRFSLVLAGLSLTILTTLLTTYPSKSTHQSSASTSPAVQAAESTPQAAGSPSGAKTVLDAQPGLWRVTRDVDGDTIDVQQGSTKETVRLIGIDTPETHDPRKTVQCYGPEAATHTRVLLEGKDVRLAPDPQDSNRDKYNRLLRYVYLPDGTLVNAELVQDGWAFAYTVFPFTKLGDFTALEAEAHSSNRGLWSACNVDSSHQIKQTTSHK